MRLIGHILLEYRYVKYFVDRWEFGTKGNLVCRFPYSLNNLMVSITSLFLSKPHHNFKELWRRQFEIPRVFFSCQKNSSIDFKKSRAFAVSSSLFQSCLSWNPFVLCLRVQSSYQCTGGRYFLPYRSSYPTRLDSCYCMIILLMEVTYLMILRNLSRMLRVCLT